MHTQAANPNTVQHEWLLVDASGRTLGRLASEVARRLRGKHKAQFTPNADAGDYVVIINAEKIRVSGRKEDDKMYHHHTGYIGNLKSTNLKTLRAKAPERIIQIAVTGMMPRGPLGRAMLRKLKIYAGASHPHTAQQPRAVTL